MLDPQLPEPQPASDLVWMLLSNQVDRRQLIRKLVEEFYPELYHQALDRLDEPAAAQRAVEHTLASLVTNAYRFDARQNLDDWIRSLFNREVHRSHRWQKLRTALKRRLADNHTELTLDPSQPPNPDQTALIISRVEEVIKGEQRRVKATGGLQWGLILSLALLLLLYLGWSEDWSLPASEPSPSVVNTRLVTHIVPITPVRSSTPSPSITPIPTSLPQSAILYIVKPGDSLSDIANRTGVDVTILAAINGLQDGDALVPGRKFIIAFGQAPQAMITPTLVTPAPTREALTDQSSPEEIFQRVRDSDRSWHTLWLDAQIIDYGPPGYIGLPFVRREQLWLISNQQGLYLSGVEGNPQPERIALSLNGTEYSFSPGETPPRIANGGPILGYTQLAQLIQPQFNDSLGHKLEILGIEKVANRDAIVVNHFYVEESGDNFHARYSIDARTGVPLRLLTYIDKAHQTLSQEIRITDIRYDQDFPPELFDPFSGAITHFARGPDGKQQEPALLASRLEGVQASARDPLPKRTPPPDFDPTQSQLAFQYLSLTRLGGAQDLAEVFAGSYYIGMIEFADPWNLSCTRSPDGRYVAFYPSLEVEPYRGHLLWFDLLDLSVLHDPLPVLAPSWTNLAFSPDNRQLAFVSCGSYDPEEDCSIYVLDLASNAAEPLLAGNGSAISWSPDGRQLAFLGAFTRNRDYQVHVIDALTGEVAYTGPFDWENLVPADVDAPINSWGITFPNWETGLEACTTPPE